MHPLLQLLSHTACHRHRFWATFVPMTLFVVFSIQMLHVATPRSNIVAKIVFVVFRRLALLDFQLGWIAALITEYLNSLTDGVFDDLYEDQLIAVFSTFATIPCAIVASFFVAMLSKTLIGFAMIVVATWLCFKLFAGWSLTTLFYMLPVNFQVRIDGQPNMHLFVRYKMNLCVVMPAVLPQIAVMVNAFQIPPILPREWPSMSELPWWIAMKLGERLPPPG